MSLRSVHIFFIVMAILTAFGFGAWSVRESRAVGASYWLGGLSFAMGFFLVYYLWRFIRKTKDMNLR